MSDETVFIDFSFLTSPAQAASQEAADNEQQTQQTAIQQTTNQEDTTATMVDISNPYADIDSVINNLAFPTTQAQEDTSQTDHSDDPMAVYPPRTITIPEGGKLYPLRIKTQVTDKLSDTRLVKDITIVSPTTLEVDGVQFTSLGRMCKVINSTNWMLQKLYFQIQVQKNKLDSLDKQVGNMITELKKTNYLYQQFIHIGEEQVRLYMN